MSGKRKQTANSSVGRGRSNKTAQALGVLGTAVNAAATYLGSIVDLFVDCFNFYGSRRGSRKLPRLGLLPRKRSPFAE